MDVIVTEGLSKSYGSLTALNELSIKIRKGQAVGFLGPNGAGKSTTIKILCSLIKPTRGSAYVNGMEVVPGCVEHLGSVGALVEVPEFYSYLTPEETLSYLGKIRGMRTSSIPSRIDEVLADVNMAKWKKTKIGGFSRGMKQRLGIAQTLIHDPDILIYDEPALGLDPRGQYEIRELVKGLVQSGKTLFMASHMLHEVRELCNSVAIINGGKLVSYNTIENLEGLLRSHRIQINTLQPLTKHQAFLISGIQGVKTVESVEGGAIISFEGSEADRAAMQSSLINEAGLQLTSFQSSLALEELYLNLVEGVR
jgi:ABC-2 type transport system ATP-binding protein